MNNKTLSGIFAIALAATGLSQASLNGINSSPLGDRSSGNIEFATWDLFPSAVIANLAAPAGDLGVTLSQSISSGPPYGPQPGAVANDLFYTFTKASSWTISGTASVDIETLVLQVKFSTPASGTVAGFFTTTLNGVGAAPTITATGVEPGGLAGAGYNILQWTWSDLDIASGQTFSIHFSNPAGSYHVAVDSIAVDVAAVPEPSTYGIAAALLLGIVIWRRRHALRNVPA
jgi:hypothetical protein